MKTNRGDRLRIARERAGYSQTAAGKALGIPTSTYSSYERAEYPGGRDYKPEKAKSFARLFGGIDANWLITGEGRAPKGPALDEHLDSADVLPPDRPRKNKTLVKGYVGASTGAGSLYGFANDQFEEIDRPRWANDQTVAVAITGKSNGPLLDGMVVFYDDVRSPVTDDLIGSMCVVGLADDRILLKKIARGPGGTFRLLSNSDEPDIENAQIEWAAKMICIAPR